MPLNVSADDVFYKGGVLGFTSLLGRSATENTFDGLGIDGLGGAMDYQTENHLLRQDIRRMQHNNVIQEELQQLAAHGDIDSAEDHPDIDQGGGDSEDDQGGGRPGAEPATSQDAPRSLEVTRAGTRRNASDSIDPTLAPRPQRIDMDDSGGARANAASARRDPSALTTAQLLDTSTAAACNHARDVPDFAHLAEESLPIWRAYVYATGTPIQQGLLEEERRAIKIPNTFKEAIT